MFKEITIVGPGLIGGSLALAIKSEKICKKIVGIDVSRKNLDHAINYNIIDEAREDIDKRINLSSIIFICTPVGSIDRLIKKISNFSNKGQIITDVGSVKNIFSKETLKDDGNKYNLVPGHPIAGTEHSGAKNAKENLFQDKWCILTPSKKNNKNVKIISQVYKKIGMKVSIMSTIEHDKIMSITSHLPHLIAFTIVGTAFNLNIEKKKELINFSAGGFKDFTRIGSSDPKMWTDIFVKNKKFLMKTLELFLKDIKVIKENIERNNEEKIFDLLKRTKEIRKSILKKESK